MYNIFYYNINKMSDELYLKELESLNLSRKKEILKKANIADRKRSIAGDMLVRKYLSKLYSTPEEKIEIKFPNFLSSHTSDDERNHIHIYSDRCEHSHNNAHNYCNKSSDSHLIFANE